MDKILPLRGMIFAKFPNEAKCADALGWHRQRLWKITTGKKEPDLEEVQALAAVLDQPFMDVANIFLRKKSPDGDR